MPHSNIVIHHDVFTDSVGEMDHPGQSVQQPQPHDLPTDNNNNNSQQLATQGPQSQSPPPPTTSDNLPIQRDGQFRDDWLIVREIQRNISSRNPEVRLVCMRVLVPGYSPPGSMAPPLAHDDVRTARIDPANSRLLVVPATAVIDWEQRDVMVHYRLNEEQFEALGRVRARFRAMGRMSRDIARNQSRVREVMATSNRASSSMGHRRAWASGYLDGLAEGSQSRSQSQAEEQNGTTRRPFAVHIYDILQAQRDLEAINRAQHNVADPPSVGNTPPGHAATQGTRSSRQSSGTSTTSGSGFWWSRGNTPNVQEPEVSSPPPEINPPSDYTPCLYYPDYVVQSHLDIIPDPPGYMMDGAGDPPNPHTTWTDRSDEASEEYSTRTRHDDSDTDEDMPELLPSNMEEGDVFVDEQGRTWEVRSDGLRQLEDDEADAPDGEREIREPLEVDVFLTPEEWQLYEEAGDTIREDMEGHLNGNMREAPDVRLRRALSVIRRRREEVRAAIVRASDVDLNADVVDSSFGPGTDPEGQTFPSQRNVRQNPSNSTTVFRTPTNFDSRRVALPPRETLRRVYGIREGSGMGPQTPSDGPQAGGAASPPSPPDDPSPTAVNIFAEASSQAPLASDGALLANMERQARQNVSGASHGSSGEDRESVASTYDLPTGSSSDVGTSAFFDTISEGNTQMSTATSNLGQDSDGTRGYMVIARSAGEFGDPHFVEGDSARAGGEPSSDELQDMTLAGRDQGYPFPVVQGPQNLSELQREGEQANSIGDRVRRRPATVGDLLGVQLPQATDTSEAGARNVVLYDANGRRSNGFSIISGFSEDSTRLIIDQSAMTSRTIGSTSTRDHRRLLAAGPVRTEGYIFPDLMELDSGVQRRGETVATPGASISTIPDNSTDQLPENPGNNAPDHTGQPLAAPGAPLDDGMLAQNSAGLLTSDVVSHHSRPPIAPPIVDRAGTSDDGTSVIYNDAFASHLPTPESSVSGALASISAQTSRSPTSSRTPTPGPARTTSTRRARRANGIAAPQSAVPPYPRRSGRGTPISLPGSPRRSDRIGQLGAGNRAGEAA